MFFDFFFKAKVRPPQDVHVSVTHLEIRHKMSVSHIWRERERERAIFDRGEIKGEREGEKAEERK